MQFNNDMEEEKQEEEMRNKQNIQMGNPDQQMRNNKIKNQKNKPKNNMQNQYIFRSEWAYQQKLFLQNLPEFNSNNVFPGKLKNQNTSNSQKYRQLTKQYSEHDHKLPKKTTKFKLPENQESVQNRIPRRSLKGMNHNSATLIKEEENDSNVNTPKEQNYSNFRSDYFVIEGKSPHKRKFDDICKGLGNKSRDMTFRKNIEDYTGNNNNQFNNLDQIFENTGKLKTSLEIEPSEQERIMIAEQAKKFQQQQLQQQQQQEKIQQQEIQASQQQKQNQVKQNPRSDKKKFEKIRKTLKIEMFGSKKEVTNTEEQNDNNTRPLNRFKSKTTVVTRNLEEEKEGIYHIYGNFEEYYTVKQVLGEGCVGLVKKAEKKSTGEQYAVKIVSTRDEETIQNMLSEFKNLKNLKHQNIVKVYEVYIDDIKGKVYTIMELIKGKEMFEVIQNMGIYTESIARKIFTQILNAIDYMHDNLVCHRDLKPNNLLCDESHAVKITDFNVSKFADSYKDYTQRYNDVKKVEMWTYTGTIAFSAPEIFSGGCYDESIDMWSAGCIMYTMLSGHEPFRSKYVDDLVELIKSGVYSLEGQDWYNISEDAKNLIKQCLTLDSSQRITPKKALEHPWILKKDGINSPSSKKPIKSNFGKENFKRLTKNIKYLEDLSSPRRASNHLEKKKEIYKCLFDNKIYFGIQQEELLKNNEQLEYDERSSDISDNSQCQEKVIYKKVISSSAKKMKSLCNIKFKNIQNQEYSFSPHFEKHTDSDKSGRKLSFSSHKKKENRKINNENQKLRRRNRNTTQSMLENPGDKNQKIENYTDMIQSLHDLDVCRESGYITQSSSSDQD